MWKEIFMHFVCAYVTPMLVQKPFEQNKFHFLLHDECPFFLCVAIGGNRHLVSLLFRIGNAVGL